MNLSAATSFRVKYPTQRSNAECKQLVWVVATSRGRSIRQQSRFLRTAQNLAALQQQRPRRTYPTRARCGEPGSQAARLIHNAV